MTQHDPHNAPFARDRHVDKPGIVGARWWHASLADQAAQIARRDAIRNILIAGGVIAGFGAMLAMCVKAASSSSGSGLSDDQTEARKTALEMQKAYGWSFGAVGEALVFDGATTKPFEPGALGSLTTDLSPSQSDLRPYFQSTLFDSPDATPTSINALPPEEREGFKALRTAVLPIQTPAMDAAYARGKSLAALFASLAETGVGAGPATANTALVVDLPGPEAVAFAAGAAGILDPVFLFDNWPHPRGVVRAQETLSAAAYYQPLFAAARKAPAFKGKRPPMFVLDRRRIAAYADDATQFDNRYVAKLPSPASAMASLGVQHVLYVVPTRADVAKELDDLNDDFVSYSTAGIDVKALSLDLFGPDASTADAGPYDTGGVYYGGAKSSHHSFFVDYPWAKPARPATARPTNPGRSFSPVARTTTFSGGNPSSPSASHPKPTNFGTVPVVIAVGTGIVLGARYSRSGSWNRSSGGFGG
ncbi:MAG: hypothetical protein JST00_19670 [Deltaproteobacteria bacterium]|nr:hypothetical protein [Deltaproteobacteria bacterium]